MKRYRAAYPRDESTQGDGDAVFVGVNCKLAPEKLGAGMLRQAVNKTLRDGRAATRAGCCTPVSHNPPGGEMIWGVGEYADLRGEEWLLLAAETAIWRCRDGKAPQRFEVPETIAGPCDFVQSAGRVLLFRGKELVPWVWDGTVTGTWGETSQMDRGDATRPVSGGITAEAVGDRLAIPTGEDSVILTDLLEPGYYDPLNVLRVNQGAGDSLVRVFPYTKTALLCFKVRSIYLVENVTGDLGTVTLTEVNRTLGLVARKAVAMVGADVFFLSQRGVYKVSEVIQDRIQTEPVAVSDPIEPLFRENVNWRGAAGAVAAVHGEYFYLALPFGQRDVAAPLNNVVLVYCTSSQQWEGWHEFAGLNVTEFARVEWRGEERLWAIDRERGAVALLYEGVKDKVQEDASWVLDSMATRGYLVGDAGFKVFERAEVMTERWRSSAQWRAETEGSTKALLLPATDRRKYFEFGVTPFVLTNVNDDHGRDGRQSYDVRPGDSIRLKSGVELDRLAPSTERAPVKLTARWVSLWIAGTEGRCDVTGVSVEARQVARTSRRRT